MWPITGLFLTDVTALDIYKDTGFPSTQTANELNIDCYLIVVVVTCYSNSPPQCSFESSVEIKQNWKSAVNCVVKYGVN